MNLNQDLKYIELKLMFEANDEYSICPDLEVKFKPSVPCNVAGSFPEAIIHAVFKSVVICRKQIQSFVKRVLPMQKSCDQLTFFLCFRQASVSSPIACWPDQTKEKYPGKHNH